MQGSRGSAVRRSLLRQPLDHRTGCQVEQVEEERVGVDDLEVELLDAVVGEVVGVERDDRSRSGPHCGSEYVSVLGVAGQPIDERLVPGDLCVGERCHHLSEQPRHRAGADQLAQVPV